MNNAYPGRKYVIELSDGATSVTSREFEVLPPVSDEVGYAFFWTAGLAVVTNMACRN